MPNLNFFSYALGVLAIALLLSVPAGAQPTQSNRLPEVDAAFQAGTAALAAENWDEAVAHFSRATGMDDTYPEAFLGLADALLGLKDYQEAGLNYRNVTDRSVNLSPVVMAQALNGRGICSREMGDWDAAMRDFELAFSADRNNAEVAANAGDMLINYFPVPEPTRALRFLDVAIGQNPANAGALRNRGWAYGALGNYDEAVLDMKRSLEVAPGDFETHFRLSKIYNRQEDYAAEITALSNAISTYKPEENTDPETFIQGYLDRSRAALTLANRADTPQAQKDELYDAVIVDADAVLAEEPDRYPVSGRALYRRGLALRMQGRLSEAIKSLDEAIQIAPVGTEGGYLAEAYQKRGICWHYQEQGSLARGDFEAAANISFEDPLPPLWIGYTYAQEGDYRQAVKSFGEALAKNPAFPLVYVNRGLAYVQLKEYKRGVDNFNEAIRHESEEIAKARHFYKRGVAYLWLEEHQKAFESFHHATLNDTKYQAAFSQAAAALEKLGKSNLAEQYQQRARALSTLPN
ncbi:MAG: tetratricopeptide repeat protein [Pirellulales bacterium]|nr:tetratricopeptide repeat protein [Pirellulales bacterium]